MSFEATWMDVEIILSQTKTNIMATTKKIQVSLFTKQKQTQRQTNLWLSKGKERAETN